MSGRVQGVGFRYYTQRKALSLGLAGYAHNLADGRVEVVAVGPRQQVEQLIEWLNTGPPTAVVEQLEVDSVPPEVALAGFTTA